MKKFKWFAYGFLILIIIILSFIIYFSIFKNKDVDIKQKNLSEIQFLESKFVNLLNGMNNIEFENYNISTSKDVNETAEQSGGSSSSGSDTGETSSKSSSGSSGSSESSSSETTSKDNKKFDLKSNGVLTNSDEINWDNIKTEIETIYTSLPTITLDLYQLNLNQEDILNFNKEFDNLTISARDENKEKTLSELSKIYEYLPKFIKNTSDEELEITTLETKSNVFKAYSKLDSNNWNEIQNDIKNATDTFSSLVTNTNVNPNKQFNVNRAYVMINELQNAVNIKDNAVFLIKYKNLLEELNNL